MSLENLFYLVKLTGRNRSEYRGSEKHVVYAYPNYYGEICMRAFLFALSFLTILPASRNTPVAEKDIVRSIYFFPLVGFIIGGILALTGSISNLLLPGLGGNALIIAVWAFITRGLHLDGLMDTADGLYSNQDRAGMLEIMKDSRVGAMGAIALVMVILLKFSFLASLPAPDKVYLLFLAPAVGRCMMVYAVILFPYARTGPGLGKPFGESNGIGKPIIATLLTMAGGFLLYGWTGVILASVTIFITWCIARSIARILGGLTGDTYGALCEISETVFIMAAVIAKSMGKLV